VGSIGDRGVRPLTRTNALCPMGDEGFDRRARHGDQGREDRGQISLVRQDAFYPWEAVETIQTLANSDSTSRFVSFALSGEQCHAWTQSIRTYLRLGDVIVSLRLGS
jgi:hypothetical protein